ncbi:anaphase promoting complex subunit 11, partial [Fimicolochytrium jonesii]|uniref:anaphase promoting complex subunit 11 n=1 Tax=Fimicolochytrium jonesii TaxID=1396493 RepID=UPI0022FEB0D7
MKVHLKKYTAVATWSWDVGEIGDEETCGICYNPFDGCCPDCKIPGDDCPLGKC